MNIILFNDACLLNSNKTIIYGQREKKSDFTSIEISPKVKFKLVRTKTKKQCDFYIEINEKINHINQISFINKNKIIAKKKHLNLLFPFENCNLTLDSDSAIITTMCKDYSSRLDEWIEYNLNLGFSGIVIFDNDGNKNNMTNEDKNPENLKYLKKTNNTTRDICEKYKGKVFCVKFNYSAFKGRHYDEIQRIALNLSIHTFRNKCGKIALIDADEFIYIPNKSNIIDFLSDYKGQTLTIKSNILTNKANDDIIDNNILDLCLYVGEDKYTKTIIDTSKIKPMEYIYTPHNHPTEIILEKDTIIHYHCWVNSRYKYNDKMPEIKSLKSK